MVDLNQVAVFAAVVRAGSFSGAARALGVPKATVSRSVSRLEDDLGALLLQRTTRRLHLTALGEAYHAQASHGLAQLAQAQGRLAEAQSVPAGTLRIAAPVEFGVRPLMQWLSAFLARFDAVKVELVLSDDYVDLVAERVDVAFRTGRLASSSLIARRLGPARRILLASPDYVRRRGEPRRIADLQDHDCVVFGASLDNVVWRLDGPAGRREVRVGGRLSANSAQAALRAAVAGLGIALLPESLAAEEVHAGRLRQVLASYGVEGGGLHLVYPSSRHMSALLRAFLDFVSRADGATAAPGRQGAGAD